MRHFFPKICFSAAAVLAVGAANANEELMKMSQNPKDWVMPTGNYANHRYSQLNQITSENAAKLQVTWTFSTGVLRGHEGPTSDRQCHVRPRSVSESRLCS